jgi:WLM domain
MGSGEWGRIRSRDRESWSTYSIPTPHSSSAAVPVPRQEPTPAAQQVLLLDLARQLAPVVTAERLTMPYALTPGVRLRTAYGHCRHLGGGRPAEIQVRCTADGDRTRWRQVGAIVGTLLHELAHLRWRHHGPRFWALQRRLADGAAGLGVYDPTDRAPNERGRGDEKLARSAAAPVAAAARAARRRRAAEHQQALATWPVGSHGQLAGVRGRLQGALVRVLRHGRTRALVQAAGGRQYWVAAQALRPVPLPAEPARVGMRGADVGIGAEGG